MKFFLEVLNFGIPFFLFAQRPTNDDPLQLFCPKGYFPHKAGLDLVCRSSGDSLFLVCGFLDCNYACFYTKLSSVNPGNVYGEQAIPEECFQRVGIWGGEGLFLSLPAEVTLNTRLTKGIRMTCPGKFS